MNFRIKIDERELKRQLKQEIIRKVHCLRRRNHQRQSGQLLSGDAGLLLQDGWDVACQKLLLIGGKILIGKMGRLIVGM